MTAPGYDYLAIAKTAAPYNFNNTWTRDTRDGIHDAYLGFSGAVGGFEYQFNYGFALARTAIHTVNPFPINPSDALNTQAYPFPTVKNQFHELRLNASYQIARNVRLGIYYLLEPFRLNDFAEDTVYAYGPEHIAPENDDRRYMFMDVGGSNYTGNLAALYLRYTLQ